MSKKILIITSQFNELITNSLEKGAEQEILDGGFEVDKVSAPGAFELPLLAKTAAASGKWAGIICLGCVIKGETPHFDYVCSQAASGILSTSLSTNTPISFGVLTTNTVDQAMNRAGLKHGNKGVEAAHAVMKSLRAISAIRELASG